VRHRSGCKPRSSTKKLIDSWLVSSYPIWPSYLSRAFKYSLKFVSKSDISFLFTRLLVALKTHDTQTENLYEAHPFPARSNNVPHPHSPHPHITTFIEFIDRFPLLFNHPRNHALESSCCLRSVAEWSSCVTVKVEWIKLVNWQSVQMRRKGNGPQVREWSIRTKGNDVHFILKIKTMCFSRTFVLIYQNTRHYTPEDTSFHVLFSSSGCMTN
jgi:hypothetical protein